MYINIEKTKTMILGGEEERIEMEMEDFKLQQVKSFKYLGVQIQNNVKPETEINERIKAVVKIYYTLNRYFLRMRGIAEKTKVLDTRKGKTGQRYIYIYIYIYIYKFNTTMYQLIDRSNLNVREI